MGKIWVERARKIQWRASEGAHGIITSGKKLEAQFGAARACCSASRIRSARNVARPSFTASEARFASLIRLRQLRLQSPLSTAAVGKRQDKAGLHKGAIENYDRERASSAFSRPMRSRRSLKASTGAMVSRALFKRKRSFRAAYQQRGSKRRVKAKVEVIVSAGAYNSPKLLMLFGAGPRRPLGSVSAPLAHNFPGVGRNLQDHAAAVVAVIKKSRCFLHRCIVTL